jgi:adenylate cyclase
MGLNVGDIVVEDGDIFGDGVDVAARLEALAELGGICVSAGFRRTRPASPILASRTWASTSKEHRKAGAGLSCPSQSVCGEKDLALPDKPSLAALPFQNMTGNTERGYFVDGGCGGDHYRHFPGFPGCS